MKRVNGKKVLLQLAEALIIGVPIVFSNWIPFAHNIVLAIGWYKILWSAVMILVVAALGILELLKYEPKQ